VDPSPLVAVCNHEDDKVYPQLFAAILPLEACPSAANAAACTHSALGLAIVGLVSSSAPDVVLARLQHLPALGTLR
jgi:hypothetical protein